MSGGGSARVTQYYEGNAMRRSGYGSDDGVFYILRDHLNSSSTIIDQSGAVVAGGNQYYYPFGGNRGAAFSDVTTKRFTGQYHEAGLPGGEGLSFYNARWYDAQLGRFISADTIVPGPGNPQAFNRYAYVLNNPLGLIDPSGHEPCATGNWGDCFPGSKASTNPYRGERRRAIVRHGRELANNPKLTSLEKFAQLTEYASRFYGDWGRYTYQDYDDYMHDMSFVITGWDRTSFVGIQALGFGEVAPGDKWLRTNIYKDFRGWRSEYVDYNPPKVTLNNQMYHFWFYVYSTMYDGPWTAHFGNRLHESQFPGESLPGIGVWIARQNRGISQPDLALGVAGVQLGNQFHMSAIASSHGAQPGDSDQAFLMLTPATVGQWIRYNLGGQYGPY